MLSFVLSYFIRMLSTIAPLHRSTILIVVLVAGLNYSHAQSSGPDHFVSLPIQLTDSLIRLPHQFLVEGSEKFVIDSAYLLRPGEYRLDVRNGSVRLSDSLLRSIFRDSSDRHLFTATYRSFPAIFKKEYRRREAFLRADSLGGRKVRFATPVAPFSFDDVFLSSNLQKSGSIVRGFTVGSNRDLSLNSGFRMQMSGRLADDLDIVAALTDENSPLQAEGTTQTLQEVDKVFIELRSTNASATIGDFTLGIEGNEFALLTRKLQGAQGEGTLARGGVAVKGMAAGAVTRGKYHSNEFPGIDGVQGPYRVRGKAGERAILVIAGTERVYVNGERMARGELNDYTIDYSIGEIAFTPRRLITQASRIIIDFEYTDRQYTRSLIATKGEVKAANDRWQVNATFMRESDNENSPIDLNLSESDKELLRRAGNDPLNAARSGVGVVGPGKGQYRSRDTIIVLGSGVDTLTIYDFAPLDTANAVYSVYFTYVGGGNGDYIPVSVGQYRFAGVRQGSYAPIRILPLPQSQSLVDIGASGKITDDLQVFAEAAGSSTDANLFSSIGDDSNRGSAISAGLHYSPSQIRIAGADIGSLNLRIRERFIDKRFLTLDRFNEVEFDRKWNIRDAARVDESLTEASMEYSPMVTFNILGNYGRLERGDQFSSKRYGTGFQFNDQKANQAKYNLELIQSHDGAAGTTAEWWRQQGIVGTQVGIFKPNIEYGGEILRSTMIAPETLNAGSFRFNEVLPGVSVDSVAGMSFTARYGWRWDDSLSSGSLRRASRSFTQSYGLQLHEWKTLSSTLDLTMRRKNFEGEFMERNGAASTTTLLRWRTRASPLARGIEVEWFYEAAAERAAKSERFFPKVPVGAGNYRYRGDLNGNNIEDEGEFEPVRFDGDRIVVTVPTEEFIPITDLKLSSRLRFNGDRLFSGSSALGSLLACISTESYIRVEEMSSAQDSRKIYLLNLSHFLNDQTTIAGSNLITQDIHILEHNPGVSARLRYTQRRGLTQFALQTERRYLRERSFRIGWQLGSEIANQTEIVERRDYLSATVHSPRVRAIHSTNVSTDWTYRPWQEVQVGFKLGVGLSTNHDSTEIALNEQSIRLIYSVKTRGKIGGEVIREEVRVDKAPTLLPFEATGGKFPGSTWLWKASAEYRFTNFIQGSIIYDGRNEGGTRSVHTAKAEVRAFF